MKYIIFILTVSFNTYVSAQNNERAITASNYQGHFSINNNNAIKRIIVNAYQKEFGYDRKYDSRYRSIHSISFNEIEQMCYDVVNSETCSEIPEEQRIKCDNLEEISDWQFRAHEQAGLINSIENMASGTRDFFVSSWNWAKDR